MITKGKNYMKIKKKISLETVIKSEVSQKEKNKYRILTHICGT